MELQEEERTESGCFFPVIRSFFNGIREMLRKRRLKQRRRNYRIAKMQEEERVGQGHDGAEEKESSEAGLSNSNGERPEEKACLNSASLTNAESPNKGVDETADVQLEQQARTPKAARKRKGNSSCEEAKPSSKRWCPVPCQLRRAEPPHRGGFGDCYNVGQRLGQGGFGCVFAGTRKEDGAQVAIKVVPKAMAGEYITVPGSAVCLPREVALIMMASEPPGSPNICRLLEWFDGQDIIILILERPQPCEDVFHFCQRGRISEQEAVRIMRQVVLAAKHCHDRGVLHRDIKAENLLINTDDMTVKLIDFGCGDILKDGPYDVFAGTLLYSPPEWQVADSYEAGPATVWSLGVLLYFITKGVLPFKTMDEIVSKRIRFRRRNLSTGCRNLIQSCLKKDPAERPDLETILQHSWLAEMQ